MQVPYFSILTVCLNAGDRLLQTIDSVLMQDFINFEIIVKDGLSNDGFFEKVPDDRRILKVKKADTGIYDAMNQALEHANGQYVLFLNAGDYFYDGTVLNSYFNAIVTNNFPALVYSDYMTTGLSEYVQSPPKLTIFFLFRTTLCHQVCMIKREFYSSLGHFDTLLKVEGDYDFLLRLLILRKANYKHIQLLGIISTSGGFSCQNRELAKMEARIVRKRYFKKTYLAFLFLVALTFPSVRIKLVNQNSFISKLYQRLVNKFNRLF